MVAGVKPLVRPDACTPDVAWRQVCYGSSRRHTVDRRIEAGYWRDVIGAEYDGLPGLSLTVVQAMRLWSIDEDIARRVLDSYVESGYLTATADGRYRRTDVVTATVGRATAR
jgi:hypothetical protein